MFKRRSAKEEIAALQQTVEGLETQHKVYKRSLEKYEHTETELKNLIETQRQKIEKLEQELVDERDQKQCLQELLDGSMKEVSKKSSCRTIDMEEDPKQTFGTNSTVLMQYKYDELCQANQRCMQAYVKQTDALKESEAEAKALKVEVEELRVKQIELNRKIEELCYRYLNYKSRKDQEIFMLRSHLEEAIDAIEGMGFNYPGCQSGYNYR